MLKETGTEKITCRSKGQQALMESIGDSLFDCRSRLGDRQAGIGDREVWEKKGARRKQSCLKSFSCSPPIVPARENYG
ncbi:hypothetical protein [Victivallis sp. Marseille-Q1083]|uniref:hypothetical protein n=1 Tax=Victivallis sp. Marseille-Q1083 TaxID=2717288 RepID=UPI001589AECB|nr:hypothetical protein [Victivallis sp. Marseille-Q1083]